MYETPRRLCFFFFHIRHYSCRTPWELQLSFLRQTSRTARVGSRGSGPLYSRVEAERHPREKQKLVIRGEIPARWPAIWEDRGMYAACERRQVESQVCLHQQLTSRQVWLLSEPSLNFWQLVWYEMLPLPNPHPSRTLVMLHKAASFWRRLCSSWVCDREMLVRWGWLLDLHSSNSISSCQESHWALMCFLLFNRVPWSSNHHEQIALILWFYFFIVEGKVLIIQPWPDQVCLYKKNWQCIYFI